MMSENDDLFDEVGDDFPGESTPVPENNQSQEQENGGDDLFTSATDEDPGLSTVKLEEPEEAPAPAPVPTPVATVRKVVEPKKDEFYLEIAISEPEKVGQGMSSFVVYKVSTKTNISAFRKADLFVKRRFSDFLGLYEKLHGKYGIQCRILPQPPAKDLVGMMKTKNTKDDATDGEFVERRRAELERFMNRLAQHSITRMDPDLREFLEHEGDLPRATSTQALSGAGMMRLFKGIGDSVSKMTVGYVEESDSWFETKAEEVNRLEDQLKRLHNSAEALADHRRSMSISTNELSRSCALLAASEENTALASAISHLSETQDKLEQIHLKQSDCDFYKLAELFRDYLGLVQSTKDAFHTRIKLYKTWQDAQTNLAKKREQKAKFELANKSDKVPAAEQEIREAEQKMENDEEEFNRVSATLKKEVAQLEKCRIADFKANLMQALEHMLASQDEILHAWESFLPEAKAIA